MTTASISTRSNFAPRHRTTASASAAAHDRRVIALALVLALASIASMAVAQPIAASRPVPLRTRDQIVQQRISSPELNRALQTQRRVTVPVEVTKRGNDVVLQTADGTVQVSNPRFLGAQVRQLPVEAVVTRAADDSVQVRKLDLQATTNWSRLPDDRKQRFSSLDVAQQQVAATADKALANDSTESDFRELKGAVETAENEVVLAYMSVPDSEREVQRELVEQHRELRRANKALYGYARDDRYPPGAYKLIYENSRGVFALHAEPEPGPRCSAVLIGDRLGLTNEHCILEESADELKAIFDYEDNVDGTHLPSVEYPITRILATDEELRGALDFLLLELGNDENGNSPGSRYPVQCLSTSKVLRDDPLYVIGFPMGEPRTVHDNAFVYFPFEVDRAGYAELEILVKSELESIAEEDASYADGKLKEFTDSYQARNDEAGEITGYEYISIRFGKQPTIGADSDTYRGNSGSPVYNRRTHAIVGLLFDGQEDLSQPWIPGWRAHEAILPITQVIAKLDIAAAEWRDDSGICIAAEPLPGPPDP
jgi:V8-like Glu-specific endopeptidase